MGILIKNNMEVLQKNYTRKTIFMDWIRNKIKSWIHYNFNGTGGDHAKLYESEEEKQIPDGFTHI